jgi:hypothetical protein
LGPMTLSNRDIDDIDARLLSRRGMRPTWLLS